MAKDYHIERIKYNIEVDEDIATHIKGWKLQRIGWAAMLLTVIGAALGLCGNGPLSLKMQVVNRDTMTYERFLRFQSHAEVRLMLHQQNNTTEIVFPSQYLKNFEIERITPEPKENQLRNDSLAFLFQGSQKGRIVFYLKPQTRGSVKGSLLVNNQPFTLSHFIYP